MQIPKELNNITPLSKFLALTLFIMLPILAFLFGMRYQSKLDQQAQYYPENSVSSVSEPEEEVPIERRTIDDLYVEVARKVPNFGGMFFDENGQLIIYLLKGQVDEQKAAEEAKIAINNIFNDDPRIKLAGEIRIIIGQYSYLQLKEWYDRMNPDVLGTPGVILTDIDERSNRIRIGIENQEIKEVIEKQLAELGIPRDAVIIEVTEPIQFR